MKCIPNVRHKTNILELPLKFVRFLGYSLNRTVNIDHQLQRTVDMRYIIETTKTEAGKRKIPITEEVAQMFQGIIEDREPPKTEKVIGGYT